MSRIFNASNRPINEVAGTTPDVSGALTDYYQPMTFTLIGKEVVAFQAVETPIAIDFRGVVQSLTERQLLLRPEGERAWTWLWLQSDLALQLNVDDVVIWKGKQTRIMSKKDQGLYGFMEYQLVQDWTGAGP